MISSEFAGKNREEEIEESYRRYKDIISNLPKMEGPGEDNFLDLYNYQGFWYPLSMCMGLMAFQDKFKSHSTDILLATNPKCGTLWLQALLFMVVNRKETPPPLTSSDPNHPLVRFRTTQLVPLLEIEASTNACLFEHLDGLPLPRLLSTHVPYSSLPQSVKDSDCKMVYVCRNPKDQLVSLWHFQNKFALLKSPLPIEVMFDKFCEGSSPWGPVWDHTLGYWKKSIETPERLLFMMYEEMKAEPIKQLKRLAEFIGFPFSEEEERDGMVDDILKFCSIKNMKTLEVNNTGMLFDLIPNSAFFREGNVGGWTNYLTPEMAKKLDQITEQKFNGTGIMFP